MQDAASADDAAGGHISVLEIGQREIVDGDGLFFIVSGDKLVVAEIDARILGGSGHIVVEENHIAGSQIALRHFGSRRGQIQRAAGRIDAVLLKAVINEPGVVKGIGARFAVGISFALEALGQRRNGVAEPSPCGTSGVSGSEASGSEASGVSGSEASGVSGSEDSGSVGSVASGSVAGGSVGSVVGSGASVVFSVSCDCAGVFPDSAGSSLQAVRLTQPATSSAQTNREIHFFSFMIVVPSPYP